MIKKICAAIARLFGKEVKAIDNSTQGLESNDYDIDMVEAAKYDYFANRKSFSCKNQMSDKFWTVNYIDDMYYVHYGKNGTYGRLDIKETESSEECKSFVEKTIREKLSKGYLEIKTVTEEKFEAHKKECQNILNSMYFMFKEDINLIYIAAVKEACEKYCDLLATVAGNETKILAAVKSLVLSLNVLTEENGIIETDEREMLCDFIFLGASLAGLDTDEDITEEWREW